MVPTLTGEGPHQTKEADGAQTFPHSGPHLCGTSSGPTSSIRENEISYNNYENNNEILKILGLNVCGLNGKINNGALYEYINEFDICCFSETKSRKGVAINDYTVFNMDTKPKKK